MKNTHWSIKFLSRLLMISIFLTLYACKDDYSSRQKKVESKFSGNVINRPIATARVYSKNHNRIKTLATANDNATKRSHNKVRTKNHRLTIKDVKNTLSKIVADRPIVDTTPVITDENNTTPTPYIVAQKGDHPLTTDDVDSAFSGNIVDGPIVNATVMIYDKNHNLIKTVNTGENDATYFTRIRSGIKNYPLTIEVEDGYDLVTEMTPDFKLLSVTLNHSAKNTNINPFTTMIVEAARAASDGLSNESISTARKLVMSQMNFGLNPLIIADPINTRITVSNVAVLTKSSEAMGEMIRRIRDRMIINGSAIDGNDVVAALAADISDGIIDGVGSNLTNPRISALSKLVSAQILIEALSNNLKVHGEVATSKIDTAILQTHPSVSFDQLTDNITINTEMLKQTREALYAAQVLAPSNELSLLSDTLDSIPANSLPAEIELVLPSNSGDDLEAAISYALLATDKELNLVNKADISQKPTEQSNPAPTTNVSPGFVVNNTNDAPVISGSPKTHVDENSPYSFQPSASDPDGDNLIFSISGKPSWTTFNISTGKLSGTPGANDANTYNNILISVSDGTVSSSLPAFSIVVNATNTAPTISGTPSSTATEDSLYVFQPTALDADGDTLTFSINNRPTWASFDPSNGRLTGTPDNGDVGAYPNITISVSDGTVSASIGAFSITVNNTNDAPVISGSPMLVLDENSSYSFQPSASDLDGDNLVFSISGLPTWATFNNNTALLSGTPGANDANTYSNILISVSDGTVSSSLPAFSIVVNATNTAPTISGSPSSTATEDSTYVFQPTALDADGDTLTFSISNRPVWANFDSTNGRLTGTPDNEYVGTHPSITISVSDGTASASIEAFSITVNNTNDAPVISGSPILVLDENNPYSFQPSASDPDGDNLVFSISGLPSWATFNNNTGLLSGTPGANDANTYGDILISVYDGTVSSSLPAFSIIVNATNTAPTISGLPSNTATEDSLYVFQPTALDADGDALTFSISNHPAWASFDPSNGLLTGTPDNGDVGAYPGITISVSDGSVSASIGAFSITVNNANSAPVISGSPTTSVEENTPYSFQPSSGDSDSDNLVFSISGQPLWASFDSSNGLLSGTPAEGDAGINSNIVISVSDGLLTTALPAFSINVEVAQVQDDTGSFTLTWTEPTSRVDNTTLFSTEIASFRIYYGTSPGFYPNSIDADYTTLTQTVTDLPIGTYYVVMTTTDTEGRESTYSQEITMDVI